MSARSHVDDVAVVMSARDEADRIAASVVAATGLCLWARDFAGYHQAGILEAYLILVSAAAATAAVSAARGVRATSCRGAPGRPESGA